jgi:tetratricopeptide (TPR) repeat protein
LFTGFRFRREIDVFPWLKFNLSKSGITATIGPENLHITVGSKGTWVYADIPGSNTYFRRKLGPMMDDLRGDDDDSDKKSKDTEDDEEESLIEYGFFDRLTARPSERAFVDTLKALNEQDLKEAYKHAIDATSQADGAFLAGFLAIQHQDWQPAVEYLKKALKDHEHLGELFAEFDVTIDVYLSISHNYLVGIRPTPQDCLLALAVAYDRMQNNKMAIKCLQEVRERYDAQSLIIRLLLAELLDETFADHPAVQHEIVTLAEGIQNDSPLHAALMYYRGRALRRLDVIAGARDTFTNALRKKKDYPADLLVALQYERALIYEKEGKKKHAHKEFEKIYAMAPELEDVANRLGLRPQIDQKRPAPLHDQTVEREPDTGSVIDYELEATKE